MENSDLAAVEGSSSIPFSLANLADPYAFHDTKSRLEVEILKPEPFYISLLLNGQKLSNCIIDSGASNNIMPSPMAKSLGLTLTKMFGRCFSMDGK